MYYFYIAIFAHYKKSKTYNYRWASLRRNEWVCKNIFLLSRCCIGYLMRNDASPNLCTAITVRHISANIKFKSTYICCAHVVQTHSKNLCGTKKQYDLLFLQLFLLKLSVIKVEVYIQSSFLQIPFVFLLWQSFMQRKLITF